MLQRLSVSGKRAGAIGFLVLLAALPLSLHADPVAAATQPAAPVRHQPSRPPGEGWTSGALVDLTAPRPTPWDHPYVDVEAANSMDNLRYGNLGALSPCYGWYGCYGCWGGFGCGWGWGAASFGFCYNTGWGGLPW